MDTPPMDPQKNNQTYHLAVITILLTFTVFIIILLVHLRSEIKDVVLFVLGVLSTQATTIYSYYFGSSKGSAMKDQAMASMATEVSNAKADSASNKTKIETSAPIAVSPAPDAAP